MFLFIGIIACITFVQTNAGITTDQFEEILPLSAHSEYLEHLNSAMDEGDITTCTRQAAFIAQTAHESAEYNLMVEQGNNCENYPDGCLYKGRGPLQLTHKSNYEKAGEALGLDLVGDPDQVAEPEVGFKVAVWFWNDHNLNSLADENTLDAFKKITKKINGGQNGAKERERYWQKAREVLGCAGRKKSKPLPFHIM
ncbi:unnamed protein product [Adineta steineri]|uniref:Glycoside hydrolase family 19 catalytic domain-containing protein n=1 Tax=Adineta steineri TaxID=433720 RepID=A0A819KXZ0_9BILA|nr:unnamed protein product [Adineta steineri]CAF3952301.1 unnamed protein product [Adineta steineri]